MATTAGKKAEQASDSAALQVLARFGLIAYAGVHLMIGWLGYGSPGAPRPARAPTVPEH
jgi:hypothetical protein